MDRNDKKRINNVNIFVYTSNKSQELNNILANMFFLQKSKWLVFAFIHFLLTFIGDYHVFSFEAGIKTYSIVKILVLIFLVFLWNKIGEYWIFYKNTSRMKPSLKFFLGYFFLLMAILVCIWPGNWFYDDIEVLEYAHRLILLFWQHKLTGIFFIFSISIIPMDAGVVIMQAFFAACVLAALMTRLQDLFSVGRWIYLFYIPFLAAPVLLQIMFPLRMTLFSFMILYVFFEIAYWMKCRINVPDRMIYKIFLFTAIFSVWRTEAAIYLLIMPVLTLFCFHKRMQWKVWGIGVLLLLACYMGLFYFQNYGVPREAQDKYFYTGLINPLSALVKMDLGDQAIEEDLPRINRIIKIDVLKKYETGEQAFFSEPDMIYPSPTLAERVEFRKAYLSLILHHLGDFLMERWDSFKKSNVRFMVEDFSKSELERQQRLDQGFMNQPFSYELRAAVLSALWRAGILYEPIYYWLLLWGLFGFGLWQREKFLLLFSFTLLCHMGVVICTAPQFFHMYYFTFQLCGYAGAMYAVYFLICKKQRIGSFLG